MSISALKIFEDLTFSSDFAALPSGVSCVVFVSLFTREPVLFEVELFLVDMMAAQIHMKMLNTKALIP
ncbi:hypothetical protein Leryth_025050 [Lithospermum erythrorhizon]|nr:hypothetical protein Leryth_025050 [Lithospermum erythrorhizon]